MISLHTMSCEYAEGCQRGIPPAPPSRCVTCPGEPLAKRHLPAAELGAGWAQSIGGEELLAKAQPIYSKIKAADGTYQRRYASPLITGGRLVTVMASEDSEGGHVD